MQHYRQHYAADTDDWMFELTYSNIDKDISQAGYFSFYDAIKEHFSQSKVGVCYTDAKGIQPQQDFAQLLANAAQWGAYPDFISVYASLEHMSDISGQVDYGQFQGYYRNLLGQIAHIAKEAGGVPPYTCWMW